MIINHSALIPHLQKNIKSIYVLAGVEHHLINEAAQNIKSTWRERGETSQKILDIAAPSDWNLLFAEANSYSLFDELVLLDVRFDKKSIDSTGKDILNQYLEKTNPRCLIILRTNSVPIKQLQWLSDNPSVAMLQITPLSDTALVNWITTQLKNRSIQHESEVPTVIHQYSQNNMLACAQTIEKLTLIYDPSHPLTVDEVLAQLIDQSEFQLYELADACLTANKKKAIHMLRLGNQQRIEPTLILWILTQEVRQLIQLSHLLSQSITLNTACQQLKIWPKRIKLYEMTLTRVTKPNLYRLLHTCKQLDEQIKTSNNHQIWQSLETLALSLC